jgi:5-methylcytosine-specific restriction endonuclease McrA
MSVKAVRSVWGSSPYPPSTRLVHLALAHIANEGHKNLVWPTLGTVAAMARISESVAAKAIRQLVRDGHLERVRPGVHRFLMPGEVRPCPATELTEREQWLATMPYAEYLSTSEWQERRRAALKLADYRCQVCNSDTELHVHHRTYERRGYERAADVVVLCAGCHRRHHGIEYR